ncbi:acrosin-like [Helicoverpa zea]|uniref:acrosin-like n=1 Tax=Helicoverpa zea TaxID=7113 RepID=UPI001F575277|nr:acrosin-like [Helicoverpa zea]
MNPCDLPPCPPCPPPPPYPVCPQTCPPGPPPPPSRSKPTMRGLHWSQTKRKLLQAIIVSVAAGACVYVFLGSRRRETYRDFYSKGEFDEWAHEMAIKGLFQGVPASSLKE